MKDPVWQDADERWERVEEKSHPTAQAWVDVPLNEFGTSWTTQWRDHEPAVYGLAEPFEQIGDRVYAVHAPEMGLVKVGFTSNISARLANLRTMSPTELRLVRMVPGGRGLEAKLHTRFAGYRVHGEWFRDVVLAEWNEAVSHLVA